MDESSWFFACQYILRKAKSFFNSYWVGMVRYGCDLWGHRTSVICCILRINEWIALIFCMLISVRKVKSYYGYAAFKIHGLSMSATKCRGNFKCFQFALAMCWQKNCQRLSRNYVSFDQGLFAFYSWDYLFYLYYFVYL